MGAEKAARATSILRTTVTVASFWLDRTEVTQAAYDACVAAKVCPPPDAGDPRDVRRSLRGPQEAGDRRLVVLRARLLQVEGQAPAARGGVRARGARRRRPPLSVGQRRADARAHGLRDRTRRRTSARIPPVAGRTVTTISPATSGSGSRTTTIRSRTRARRASEGKPGTCDEIVAAQNKLRAEDKQGFTGLEPDPDRVREVDPRRRLQLPRRTACEARTASTIPPSFKLRMTGVRCAKDM